MSANVHKIFIAIMVIIVIVTTLILSYIGFSYYQTNVEERFFHPDHNILKPSGILGHGLGVIGSFLTVFGMVSYMIRKRVWAPRWGSIKFWLELHIFLCTLGPVMILFHTAFKFGGLVAVSFWSMVIVFVSGIAGRFIYIQIPRTIEGKELSLTEVRRMKNYLEEDLKINEGLDANTSQEILSLIKNKPNVKTLRIVKNVLKKNKFPKPMLDKILKIVKKDILLNRKIERLDLMQKLFRYWHVVHLPFALIMIIIMVIHIAVTVALGYKWVF